MTAWLQRIYQWVFATYYLAKDNNVKLTALLALGAQEMSALSDLQAAEAAIAGDVTAVGDAVASAITLIQSLQNNAGGVAAADVEAVVAQLQSAHTALTASAASLTGALTPAPAPAP